MCQPAPCGIPAYFMSGESFGKKELARATFVYYKRPALKDDLQQQCQHCRVHNQYTLHKQGNKPLAL